MLRKIHFCLLAGLIFTPAFSQQRVVDYVNPIIGTNGMGHTFPGPCVPFGLIQLSPDTDTIPHNIMVNIKRMFINIVQVISIQILLSLDLVILI